MSYWVSQDEDKRLPDGIKAMLSPTCGYCGGKMLNYYNDKDLCTNRKCNNPTCVSIVAPGIVRLCEILKVQGIGIEGAKAMALAQPMKLSYLEYIPAIFEKIGLKAGQVSINLYELFQMLLIPGVSETWANICNSYDTVDDVLSKYTGEHRSKLIPFESILKDTEKMFNINKRVVYELEPLVTGNVMITGSIPGFVNRDDCIALINQLTKGLVQLNVVDKRKTNVLCLIQGQGGGSGKVEVAKEIDIPILTYKEFRESWLPALIERRGKERV